jgi:hypothetical protein
MCAKMIMFLTFQLLVAAVLLLYLALADVLAAGLLLLQSEAAASKRKTP